MDTTRQTPAAPTSPSERWTQMAQGHISAHAQAMTTKVADTQIDEVWANDLYECQVRYLEPDRKRAGMLHLSIKHWDRTVIRDWRHLQAIKNDVCGWEREGLELFPAESRLVDGANQTHIWVLPAHERIPIGFNERAVQTQSEMEKLMRDRGIDPAKGRQRDWQPGISTGPNYKPGGRS